MHHRKWAIQPQSGTSNEASRKDEKVNANEVNRGARLRSAQGSEIEEAGREVVIVRTQSALSVGVHGVALSRANPPHLWP